MYLDARPYRGRLAPSPTGYLHLGHARTFWTAQQRAREYEGTLILRNDDLDTARCQPEFVRAMIEDLEWFGFQWDEGPDRGGPVAPYNQSERRAFYVEAFGELRRKGLIYPCVCSRQDVLAALTAPHPEDDEPVYPGTCRPLDKGQSLLEIQDSMLPRPEPSAEGLLHHPPSGDPLRINWRFRVDPGDIVRFQDDGFGQQRFTAGTDFGDFVVWRHDDMPAYHLAVVVDDNAMGITEVVRGEDLLRSTARQILVHNALQLFPPAWCHCPLMTDEDGRRLAKRHKDLSLRELRKQGKEPPTIRGTWSQE